MRVYPLAAVVFSEEKYQGADAAGSDTVRSASLVRVDRDYTGKY